jgi:hypothetical protein
VLENDFWLVENFFCGDENVLKVTVVLVVQVYEYTTKYQTIQLKSENCQCELYFAKAVL